MHMEIVREMTPEEIELQKKQAELEALEVELTQRELELVTFQAELNSFRNQYLQALGKLYAELDAIWAEIAALQAKKKPADHKAREKAEQAREQAEESAKAANIDNDKSKNFKPTERLKKLYREIAKNYHPDLAVNEEERNRYQQVMSEANRAYKDGDEQLLERILTQREHDPEVVKGNDTGADLVRVIRKIARIEARLKQITNELALLKESSLFQLKMKVEAMAKKGINLFTEMAGYLNREIIKATRQLNKAKSNN